MSDQTRLKTQIAPAELPGLQSLTMIIVSVVAVAGLYLAREVLVPLTLAILLSFVLAPLVALLRRTGLPRSPAVIVSVLLALGVFVVIGGLIGSQVASIAADMPRYAATLETKMGTMRAATIGRIQSMSGSLGSIEHAPPMPQDAGPRPLPVEVHQPDPSPLDLASRVLSPIVSPLATMGIVLLVAVFILMQREDLRDRLIRLFGSSDLHRTTAAMDDAGKRLSRYFLTQLLLNAAFGVVIAIGVFAIGVPSPVLWGIVAALMRFVPYIGAVGAAAFPLAMAAAVDPGWSMVLWTVALFGVIEPLVGQVIEPLVYGRSTGLSPVSVVIAAIFWTWLWGPVGLILSMPLTLCLVVLGRHIDRLQFIDVLLGDQPALTPAESFYQRILAGDADEALDQAETLLKERSLSSYYDEVAMRGLRLAANDQARGVLTDDQLANVLEAIDGIVLDLDSHDDADPPTRRGEPASPAATTVAAPETAAAPLDAATLAPEWSGPAPILCVAGRGALDEAACTMLAQLLGKHGLRARVVRMESVSRANIAALDTSGLAMVCISFLESGGSLSGLRYMARRLRGRLPDAPLLVGAWHADVAVESDERLRLAVGADHAVTTLRDAVNACLAAARVTTTVLDLLPVR